MHEGSGLVDVTPGKNRRDTGEAVAALQDGSPGKDDFGSVSAAGSDLGHEDAEKALHDLDREIEALQSSIREVNSQIKAASLRKEQKKRTDRLSKLRKELFVAQEQLQKAEEEGELNKRDDKSRNLMTNNSKPSQKTVSKTRASDSKGVSFN